MINQLFAAFGPTGGAPAQGSGGSPTSLIFMIIAIFAVMYFLMIRPQQKQKKQHQSMINTIAKGDKVVTIGGMHGTVAGIKDSSVIIKIADNVKVEINRSAINQVLSSKAQKTQASKEKQEEEVKKKEKQETEKKE